MLNNILDFKAEVLAIISGPTLSGKTKKMLDILKELTEYKLFILYISLELSKQEISKRVLLSERVIISNNNYVEDIKTKATKLKLEKDLKLILIDGVMDLRTKQEYCLGQADIKYEILKQLKDLTVELGIAIIMTGPDKIENEVKNIDTLDIKTIKINSARKHQDRF